MNKIRKRERFLQKLRKFLKENGYSLGHEDHHGAFILVEYDDKFDEWLSAAFTNREISNSINCSCSKINEKDEQE